MDARDAIVVRGARVHNLADVDVDIPRGKLVVVTGPSGSGKSSLAFDTIYAEARRRFIESMSASARQLLERIGRPDVDYIEGLSPAIALEQHGRSGSPRATVATASEVHDYLRVLLARLGRVTCWNCGAEIAARTVQEMVDAVRGLPERQKLVVTAPVVREQPGDHFELLAELRRAGYVRIAVDGALLGEGEPPEFDPAVPHTIEVQIDRLVNKDGIAGRLADSIELALRLGGGVVRIEVVGGDDLVMSDRSACSVCGTGYPPIEPRLLSFNHPQGACPACGGLGRAGEGPEASPCPDCQGTRLRIEARHVTLDGRSIADLAAEPIAAARSFLAGLTFGPAQRPIADPILAALALRLGFLERLGVGYLALDRAADTLSAGEAQRIRLATQLGASLVGVLYVLDEPSVGLHPRDQRRLLEALLELRDRGNTVLLVEHDAATIEAADHIVDMGPGAGPLGGQVVATGSPAEIRAGDSLTGLYLRDAGPQPLPRQGRTPGERWLGLRGARANNLRGVDVRFPVGLLTCVSGVSGSGKSSLVIDTLVPAIQRALGVREAGFPAEAIDGAAAVTRVVSVDQAPIGRTPRSTPATFAGIFDVIRELYANLPEARARGYRSGRFSFNVKGGRCEACRGDGLVRVEMALLPDVYVTCEVCGGKRFDRETLEVRYKGLSIAELLALTVDEAAGILAPVPKAASRLRALRDVGLGYLVLGQSATTLSGGEAQRLKLARELGKPRTGATLFVLDEPTTGLHADDVRRLLHVLQLLVDEGGTVVVIEHDLDVVRAADWVIDVGPEAGAGGGLIVAEGAPDRIAAAPDSHTGAFLKTAL